MENKRKIDESTVEKDVEKESVNKRPRFSSKMYALLIMYSGKGYYGIQRNPGFPTIEEDMLQALRKTDLISEDHYIKPGMVKFNRASKTDKNVSATGQVLSMKLPSELDAKSLLNEVLPAQIRVIDAVRVTKSFNAKNSTENRTYMYVCPSLAFAPSHLTWKELTNFRLSEEQLQTVRRLLLKYRGTKNYYNFTSGRKVQDKSCIRYMIDLECSEPYVRDELEFVRITIIGQSFMLHQIRKMVALVMSVMGGFTTEDIFNRVFNPVPQDIPKAPGLGLLLYSVNYDSYNKRFGRDGMHQTIDWSRYKDEIEKFREEVILTHIYKEENESQSMMKWRETITNCTFGSRPPVLSDLNSVEHMDSRRDPVTTDEQKTDVKPDVQSQDDSNSDTGKVKQESSSPANDVKE